MKLHFCFTITPQAPLVSLIDLDIDAAAKSLADARLSLARQERGKFTETISETVDTAVSAGTSAQAIADGAQKLSGEQVIGAMINALDTLVRIGDEISMVR